jgi:surface protein
MLRKTIIVTTICFTAILLATSCTESTAPGMDESLELYAGLEAIPEASSTNVTINRGSEEARDGYFMISIDNMTSNSVLLPGQHEAWCLEWNKSLRSSGDVHQDVKWFSSNSNDKWKPLNYFFSIRKQLQKDDPSLTFREIQAIVWVLAGEMKIAPEFDVLSIAVNQLPNRLRTNGQVNFDREKVDKIAKAVMQDAPSASIPYTGTIAQTAEDQQDIFVPADERIWKFITTWDTSLGPNATVTLALAGSVDATIYWGDGTITDVTTPGPHTHDYGTDGIYTVSVQGNVGAYNSDLNSTPDETQKLLTVESWGDLGFTDLGFAFYKAINLKAVPNHSVGINDVTNMESMFREAAVFNSPIGDWDTEGVTKFYRMFDSATNFNQPIGDWNTSTVTYTGRMFYGTREFDQPLNDWDMSNVTNMANMFLTARAFNQDIGDWDTGAVTNMKRMFGGARSFNQDLSGWCVENIASIPADFDSGADEWVLDRPVWGTCPE